MIERIQSWFDSVFYGYVYGDWDSLSRWAWIYVHIGIFVATVLVGFTLARGDYILTLVLLVFPISYLYRRYTYARNAIE
jgi:hypothetical protein